MQPPTIPALRVSSFDSLQQQAMIPVNQAGSSIAVTKTPPTVGSLGPALTFQQQQQQYQYQQQLRQQSIGNPHALQQLALLPQAAIGVETRSAPLAAALHNADCIRTGIKSPWVGGWTGCRVGPWCNIEPGHTGACNTRATIPGLSAYLPEELAAVGLQAVVELTAPLPPPAAAAALAAATAAAKAAMQVAGGHASNNGGCDGGLKRKAEPVSAAPVAASSEGGSLTASDNHSNNGDEAVQQELKPATRTSKRKKAIATENEALNEVLDSAGTDNEAVSEEHKSSMTGEAKLRVVAPTPRKGRGRGRKARAAPAAATMHVESVAAKDGAGAEDLGSSGAAVLTVEKPAHRPMGRRAPQQWISGEALDPRSGKKVTVVPPATFCTQCSATSTPVWRAGPFGHKTLCNACGVRWMKVAPRARK